MKQSLIRQWIDHRQLAGSKFGTERVAYVLEKLGHPQQSYPIIHVTGTNGKGSTSAFIKAGLMSTGLRVGVFSSPALVAFEEQIMINQTAISPNEFDEIVSTFKPIIQVMDDSEHEQLKGMTGFEMLVVAMFVYFAEQQVDIAIVEVGLGGRLDATNVITPLVSVITTIALEHTDVLGPTLEVIAQQKAGIIKQHIPVVCGRIAPEPMCVIQRSACAMQAPLYQLNVDFFAQDDHIALDQTQFQAFVGHQSCGSFAIQMSGRHQVDNAMVALQTLKIVFQSLQLTWDNACLIRAFETVRFAGRLEKIAEKPLCFLDGAHNPAGIDALMDFVEQGVFSKQPCTQVYIVIAVIKGKDLRSMLERILAVPAVQKVFLTTFDDERAWTLAELQDVFATFSESDQARMEVVAIWQSLMAKLLQPVNSKATIFVTGSLYFLAQVRRRYYKHSDKQIDATF